MKKVKLIIKNPTGLHLRPAKEFTQMAMNCQSEVVIEYGEKVINGKSIMNLMAAGIAKDSEITLICHGETEAEDIQILQQAIESGLGE
ncbi:HPr family phosphocarrier protein [Eubacterium barkeri]|uniref:Phosphocarrier protein n=1 Tax=Eubacterium barkeri TaxID=1528 RepID=A0A1H3JKW0_EUBBA|nr:HPr family phosphocarrier protein [Eubacterium barkeri]SDY40556.1 phosphocarrier protein [Eubacterium barkeri]